MVTIADLQAIRLFENVDEETLAPVASECSIKKLFCEEALDFTGADKGYMFFVRSGYLFTRYPTTLLKEDYFFIGWRGPGHILGEMGVLKPIHGLDLTGVVIEAIDDSELIKIPGSLFLEAAENSPAIFKNFTNLLIKKIVAERKRAEVTQISNKTRRVAKALLNLYEERGTEPNKSWIRGTIRVPHIAGYIGTGQDAVMNNLNILEEMGAIVRTPIKPWHTRKIGIRDISLLYNTAGENT